MVRKPETATRVKQRCHAVMKWCWAQELVKSNPVDVVDHLLPQQPGKESGHSINRRCHGAMFRGS